MSLANVVLVQGAGLPGLREVGWDLVSWRWKGSGLDPEDKGANDWHLGPYFSRSLLLSSIKLPPTSQAPLPGPSRSGSVAWGSRYTQPHLDRIGPHTGRLLERLHLIVLSSVLIGHQVMGPDSVPCYWLGLSHWSLKLLEVWDPSLFFPTSPQI